MRIALSAVAACFVLSVSSPAAAWGWRGHEIVGSIAQQLLERNHPVAAGHVRDLLGGESLAVAATWADCVKDVSRSNAGVYRYHVAPKTPKVCVDNFQSQVEVARMIDYASRNWSQCDYSDGGKCHSAYHFDDVAIQRGAYGDHEGANEHDLVHAINAAIAVLQGKPCPAPFNIRGKQEALRLLAHFVGDLHQPLHVGSIYLDASGQVVDPDPPSHYDPATFTVGGNSLVFGADGGQELHADWDTVSTSYGTSASAALVGEAAALSSPGGVLSKLPAAWASEGIVLSKSVFDGLSFGAATAGTRGNQWQVTFSDRAQYIQWRGDRQHEQMVKAGARLAYILARICDKPTACKGP